jgi:hypothetical protein
MPSEVVGSGSAGWVMGFRSRGDGYGLAVVEGSGVCGDDGFAGLDAGEEFDLVIPMFAGFDEAQAGVVVLNDEDEFELAALDECGGGDTECGAVGGWDEETSELAWAEAVSGWEIEFNEGSSAGGIGGGIDFGDGAGEIEVEGGDVEGQK